MNVSDALISNKMWTRIILCLWLGLLTIAQAQAVSREWRTAEHWLSVRKIEVKDAEEGACPEMVVERTIRRPFVGDFIATIFVLEQEEGVLYPPSGSGRFVYLPAARMPVPLKLDWWMNWTDCNRLHAGRYFVRTAWIVHAPGYPQKVVPPVDSNVFTVRARQ